MNKKTFSITPSENFLESWGYITIHEHEVGDDQYGAYTSLTEAIEACKLLKQSVLIRFRGQWI